MMVEGWAWAVGFGGDTHVCIVLTLPLFASLKEASAQQSLGLGMMYVMMSARITHAQS